MNIRRWIIKKLAGDTLVILNATLLYKYFPIFADSTKNPIVDNNQIIKVETNTPFLIYDTKIFEMVDNELKIKDEYLESYNKAVKDIQSKMENQDNVAKEASSEGEVVV